MALQPLPGHHCLAPSSMSPGTLCPSVSGRFAKQQVPWVAAGAATTAKSGPTPWMSAWGGPLLLPSVYRRPPSMAGHRWGCFYFNKRLLPKVMVPLRTATSDPKGALSLHIHPLILKRAQRPKGLVHFSKCKNPKTC